MTTSPTLPAGCEQHQPDYKQNAWQDYTLQELGMWVHLFVKRAGHRSDRAKTEKDLQDADNYLSMMKAHIDHARATEAEAAFYANQPTAEEIDAAIDAQIAAPAPQGEPGGSKA